MKIINVTCAIIEKDGKFLISQRKDNGKWEFPGGKVETGESERDCLKRELKEELDIEVDVTDLLCRTEYDYGETYVKLVTFVAIHISGEMKKIVHKELAWIDFDEFGEYDFLPADEEIIEEILNKFSS